LCQLLYWHIPTQCRGSGDALATNIYGSAKSHYSVFMGYFVGRESLSSTSMQVAMVMVSQFVMVDPPFTRPHPHTHTHTSSHPKQNPQFPCPCHQLLEVTVVNPSEVLCCSVCVCVCVCVHVWYMMDGGVIRVWFFLHITCAKLPQQQERVGVCCHQRSAQVCRP